MRLWQASGNWYIGPASKAGKMAGWWRCRDGARIPEQVKGCWEVGDGKEWHRAEHVRCTEFVMPRLMLKGGTPDDRHQDKLGTYLLCEGELVNDRTCYAQHGNPSRMCWFLTPYWYVGKREEKGLGQGWLQARSLAHHPEQIASVWSVWRSADKKWVQAPDVKVQADGVAKAVLRPGAELEPRVPLAGGEAAAGADGGAVGGGDGISDATLMVAEDNPQMAISPQAALDSARFDVFLSHDCTRTGGSNPHPPCPPAPCLPSPLPSPLPPSPARDGATCAALHRGRGLRGPRDARPHLARQPVPRVDGAAHVLRRGAHAGQCARPHVRRHRRCRVRGGLRHAELPRKGGRRQRAAGHSLL